MRVALALAFSLTAAGLRAATAPSDREQLRGLLTVPQVHVSFGFGVSIQDGIVLQGDESNPATEIPKIKASLSGNVADSPRYLRLARLYSRLGETGLSSNALRQAVALARKRMELQPESAEAMRRLGEALAYVDKHAEAESLFRRAVKTAPTDWESQAGLGRFLVDRAIAVLERDADKSDGFPALLAFFSEHRLAAGQVERCRDLVTEGDQCLNRAVELAPESADARLARVQFRTLAEMTRLFIRLGLGEKLEPADLFKTLAPIVVLPDIRRALELRPDDPRLAALGACYEMFIVAGNRGVGSLEDLANGRFYQTLTDSEQRMLRNKLRRLEELGQSANPTNAAAALQYLGSLQFLLTRDLPDAAANLRRAVALDSSREQAWDMLMASLALKGKKDDECLAVAGARVKVSPTARNLVLLAKAAHDAGRADRALAAAEKAVKLDPQSFFARHTLGVLLALQARDQPQLRRAGRALAAAGKLVDSHTPPADVVRYLVNAACYHGLAGDAVLALKLARQAIRLAPKDEDARTAESILQRMTAAP